MVAPMRTLRRSLSSLCQELTLSNTSDEVYKDDLTVTYTAKTSKDVDKITLSQLESTKRPTYYFEDIIDFIDTEGGETHTAYTKCDFHFPRIDVSKGVQPLINNWIKYNLDEPLFLR